VNEKTDGKQWSGSKHRENYVRELFAKFVDSPYYSESELCGGVVTVSFSTYLPWQAMHFSKTELQAF
jgi:hypothetical protein